MRYVIYQFGVELRQIGEFIVVTCLCEALLGFLAFWVFLDLGIHVVLEYFDWRSKSNLNVIVGFY